MQARALWHRDDQRSELRALSGPEHPGLTLRSHASLISVGTERLVCRGEVPPTLWDQMQVPYQEGSLGLPVKYGYSLVGEVLTAGHPWQGRMVHLLHPHQDLVWPQAQDLTLIPAGIPPQRATLLSNLETAVNAVWDSQASVGDRCLVLGFGIIGALTAQVLRQLPAVEVFVAETDPQRRQLAAELGFTLWEGQHEWVDLAFHASASSAGLQAAVDTCGPEGTVVELSWYGTRPVTLGLGGDFHAQRKRIVASQVSRLPANRLPRWDFQRRKQTVLRLLQDPRLDQFLTHRIPFAELPAWFDRLRDAPPAGLGQVVLYPPIA